MRRRALYSELAKYYDRIYWWKDYGQEVSFLVKVFRRYDVHVKRILEVACGTGSHTEILTARGYLVTGVDIGEEVLRIARSKVRRHATFIQGDMKGLDTVFDRDYDAVICLFSAISYNLTIPELKRTIRGFYDHLKDGGIVVFNTRFTKKGFMDGHRDESVFDDGKVIGARTSISKRKTDIGEISFTYLIKDGAKVIVMRNDVHRLGLFDPLDFLQVMKEVGFAKTHVYADWTFKGAAGVSQYQESVYVGYKPRRAIGS